MEDMRESYDNVAFLYVSDDMKWGRKNLKDKENDLYFVGKEDASFDFALLCQCNHTIISRGAFTYWISLWTGMTRFLQFLKPFLLNVDLSDLSIQNKLSEPESVFLKNCHDTAAIF